MEDGRIPPPPALNQCSPQSLHVEHVLWWSPLANEIKLIRICSVMWKLYIVYRTRVNNVLIALSLYEDQTTATDKNLPKILHLKCDFWDMRAGRQTYKHTDCTMLLASK